MGLRQLIGNLYDRAEATVSGGIATDPIWTGAEQLAYGTGAGIGATFTMATGVRTFLTTPTLANLDAAVSDANIARTDAAQGLTDTQTITKNGVGVTAANGLVLQNTTAAADGAGNQQWSPSFTLIGQGDSSAGSQAVQFRMHIEPTDSAGSLPTGNLKIYTKLGAATENLRFQFTDAGNILLTSGTSISSSSGNVNYTAAGIAVLGDASHNAQLCGLWTITATTGNISSGNIAYQLQFGGSSGVILAGESAGVLQMGADAAGVTNQMLKACDRITSDGVGAHLTLAGGRNRGASVGGSVIFQTSPPASAGVTGTLETGLTIDSPTAGQKPSVAVGSAALATTATDGFLYIPSCAGTPAGVPTAKTGRVPMVWDSTNKKFYIYDGGWLGGTAPGVFS